MAGRVWRRAGGDPDRVSPWDLRAAGVAVIISALAITQAGARMLDTLFPEGMPGYGTQPGVTVLSRLRSDHDPLGIREGAFRLFPRLETAIGYDDNIFGSSSKRGSWTAATRPSVLALGDWSTHTVAGYASVSDTRYPDQPRQSRTDATVALGGTIEVGQDRLTLAASHVVTHQDRTALDALASDRPVGVQVTDVRAEYAIRAGRFTWTPHIAYAHWRFGDTTVLGTPVSQSYRDRNVLRGGVTLRYEIAPLRNVVVLAQGLSQTYPKPGLTAPATDSTGVRLLVGFDYDDNAVWRYRMLIGAETRQFASSAYRSHTGLSAEGEVLWTPSGMTTVSARLQRGIEDAAQEGIAGFTYTAGRLRLDHELTRQVLLHASAGLQQAVFLQNGGRQWGYSFGVGATWLINRSMRLSATYDGSGIRGANPNINPLNGDYGRNVALLTLRLGL